MNKNNFFLDLDNTLIHAISYKKITFIKNNKDEYTNKIDYSVHKKYKHYSYIVLPDEYVIFIRRYLDVFLSFLFKNFNVCVWTAANASYATEILLKIISPFNPKSHITADYILNNKFKCPKKSGYSNIPLLTLFLTSAHCDISEKNTKTQKNLKMISGRIKTINIGNSVILDDNPEVYRTQPYNCIRALPFNVNKISFKEDKFLLNLTKKMSENKSLFKNLNELVNKLNE